MCGRVAVGAGQPPCQVAEFQCSRGQRAQAAQDSGVVHSRFTSVESNYNRQIRTEWRSSHGCFRQDGDTHRRRQFVSAKRQPFQSANEQSSVCGGPALGRRLTQAPLHRPRCRTSEPPPSLVDALEHDLNGVPPLNRGRRRGMIGHDSATRFGPVPIGARGAEGAAAAVRPSDLGCFWT